MPAMAKRTIAGSRVLITGASGGIGREIALQLGRHGADVVLLARREDRLRELAKEFEPFPGRAEMVVGDVTDANIRHAAIEKAVKKFGGLDILINNAGIGAIGLFKHADDARLRRIMEVNFFAAAEMIRLAIPVLHHGNHPIVVNIGSILGHRGIPHSSEYCASKFALQGLSQSLRAEFQPMGIDLLVVSPGTTETEFFDNALELHSQPPWLESRGLPAEKVAREAVAAIASGRHEIIPNFRGRLLCRLQRLCPTFVNRLMARYGK